MRNVRSKMLPLATIAVLTTLAGASFAQSSFNTTIQHGWMNTNDSYQRGDLTDNATYQEGWDNANRTAQFGRENRNQTGQFGRTNYNETRQYSYERRSSRQVSSSRKGKRRNGWRGRVSR